MFPVFQQELHCCHDGIIFLIGINEKVKNVIKTLANLGAFNFKISPTRQKTVCHAPLSTLLYSLGLFLVVVPVIFVAKTYLYFTCSNFIYEGIGLAHRQFHFHQ